MTWLRRLLTWYRLRRRIRYAERLERKYRKEWTRRLAAIREAIKSHGCITVTAGERIWEGDLVYLDNAGLAHRVKNRGEA